jgi:hypothetical protein
MRFGRYGTPLVNVVMLDATAFLKRKRGRVFAVLNLASAAAILEMT